MAPRPGREPNVPALYSDECAECSGMIHPGELITNTAVGWVHVECPDERPTTFQGTSLDEMGY